MNSYSLLKAMGDMDDKYVMEALNARGKAKLGAIRKLILVAVLIFLLAATALAVYHSPLLSMLFSRTEGEPTKAAEEHLVQPDATSQPKPQMAACDFHIDEYLLDGDHLYLSYSLQNPTEEPLIYEVSLRTNGRALGATTKTRLCWEERSTTSLCPQRFRSNWSLTWKKRQATRWTRPCPSMCCDR